MNFKLNIHIGNAAMQSPADVGEALRKLSRAIDEYTMGSPLDPITMGEHTRISGNVLDGNGNLVGNWEVTK